MVFLFIHVGANWRRLCSRQAMEPEAAAPTGGGEVAGGLLPKSASDGYY
jgi:hypothetical protein